MNRTHCMLSALTLFATTPLFAQADLDVQAFAKQLAGPPAEIEAMRAPSPVDATIHSRSALLPVRFADTEAGEAAWRTTVPIENGSLRFLVFAPRQASWQVGMVGASGRSTEAGALAARVIDTDFGIGEARIPAVRYDFDNLQGDRWGIELRSGSNAAGGFILVEGDADTELASYPTHTRQLVGERLGLTALLTSSADDTVRVGKKAGGITEAVIRVTAPDGSQAQYAMFDDGHHDDG